MDLDSLQVEIELLQKALSSAEKKLAETQNIQNDFIALASHDLQSPIRKLNLYVDKLITKNKTTLDNDSLFYIDRIKLLCRHATLLIDDLAFLSDRKNEIKLEDCDLNKTIEDVIGEMKVHGNENTFIIKNSLPVIKADRTLIKDLFNQLLSNAIIFKKENVPLKVVVESTMLDNKEKDELPLNINKSYYKITVTDNGIGFDKQYNEKIFLPFYKLQGNSIHKGGGLGLAICKLIVEKHNGFIYASGEINLGAQFALILPSL
jgi:light-regulated signal transduction histidine kinase (bacteriophytochrome)